MKLCIALTLMLFCMQGLPGQKGQPEVLSSGGDHMTAANLVLDWTLGELVVETKGIDPLLTQGFHQGNLKVSTAVLNLGQIYHLAVFPNPTTGHVTVQTEFPDARIELMDVAGRILYDRNASFDHLDLTYCPAGTYIIRIWGGRRPVAISKIQKF